MKTIEERAMDTVQKRNTGHKEFVVLSVVPKFLDGTLYIIGFRNADGGNFENYAYVSGGEDEEVHVYRNTVQLSNAVSINQRRETLAEKILTLGGIAGGLALVITVTICYLTVVTKGEVKFPEVLSNALTMILGFYFGTKAQKKDA